MGPLGQEAGCVPRHCTENNLCRPPHAGARHDAPAAPTSAHRTTRHGEPNTTSVPNDGLGVSFGVTPRQTCPQPEGLGRNLRPNHVTDGELVTSQRPRLGPNLSGRPPLVAAGLQLFLPNITQRQRDWIAKEAQQRRRSRGAGGGSTATAPGISFASNLGEEMRAEAD